MTTNTTRRWLTTLVLPASLLAGCKTGRAVVVEQDGNGQAAAPAEVSADVLAGQTPEQALALEIALTQAADRGDVDGVKRLLAEGADPDGISGTKARRYRHAIGRPAQRLDLNVQVTPLIACLRRDFDKENRRYIPLEPMADYVEVVRLLVAAGADPNIRGPMGIFALFEASASGATEAVQHLIAGGARVKASFEGFPSIDSYASDPNTALDAAIDGGHHEVMRRLLDAYADAYQSGFHWRPLTRSVRRADPEATRILIESMREDGSVPGYILNDALEQLIQQWSSGAYRTEPVEKAEGYRACFRLLVEQGASLGQADVSLWRYSAARIDDALFKTWLAAQTRPRFDAELDAEYLDGLVSRGTLEALRQALDAGLDPNAGFVEFGMEPWHPAVGVRLGGYRGRREQESIAAVRLLLERGMRVDARDQTRATMLHYEAENGVIDQVRFLLEHGAPVNAEDFAGRTPLDDADDAGEDQVVALLRAAGGMPGGKPPRSDLTPQAQAHPDPRLIGLLDPERRADVFARVVEEQRYDRATKAFRRASVHPIRSARRIDLPEGPPAYLVFHDDADAQGRSTFTLIRGDGAMLPQYSGEDWRLRPEDVLDLDHDGIHELLIDATLSDAQTKLAALRIIPTAPSSDALHWAILYRHRDEPGPWAWRVGKARDDDIRMIEIGPAGADEAMLWVQAEIVYDHEDLEDAFEMERYHSPWKLIRGGGEWEPELPFYVASYVASMYPSRYR